MKTICKTICITGPTASGKTAVALAVAARLPCEIVSVDSALIYRGMDIGTAKPSAQELAQVPHHLVNTHDPAQSYSAAEFAQDAATHIAAIHARGKHALLVGGTMLYIKALTEGLDDLPPANPQIRAAIEAQAALVGWPALHSELALVDPAAAARLPPTDSQRISRALEVYRATGKPLSSHFTDAAQRASPFADLPLVSLEPAERPWLHGNIEKRLNAMFAADFVGEVQQLRARGDLHLQLPSMRCVGYRQVWEGLDSGASTAAMLEKAVIATRQLAKRQMTWLRSMPLRRVVACDAPTAVSDAVAAVLTGLEGV